MDDIGARVRTVVIELGGLEHGDADDPTRRLSKEFGFDSMDMVELAMALEDEFQIAIPDVEWDWTAEEALGGPSIQQLIDIVRPKVAV